MLTDANLAKAIDQIKLQVDPQEPLPTWEHLVSVLYDFAGAKQLHEFRNAAFCMRSALDKLEEKHAEEKTGGPTTHRGD